MQMLVPIFGRAPASMFILGERHVTRKSRLSLLDTAVNMMAIEPHFTLLVDTIT